MGHTEYDQSEFDNPDPNIDEETDDEPMSDNLRKLIEETEHGIEIINKIFDTGVWDYENRAWKIKPNLT